MIERNPNAELYSFGHRRTTDPQRVLQEATNSYLGDQVLDFPSFARAYARRDVVNSSTVCVRKESLFQIGGFPVGALSGEDSYVWLRLGLRGSVVCNEQVQAMIESREPTEATARPGVPYHFQWFSESKNRKNMTDEHLRAYGHFLSSRALAICGGAILEGRRKDALRISWLVLRTAPLVSFSAVLLFAIPRPLLRSSQLLYRRWRLRSSQPQRSAG